MFAGFFIGIYFLDSCLINLLHDQKTNYRFYFRDKFLWRHVQLQSPLSGTDVDILKIAITIVYKSRESLFHPQRRTCSTNISRDG